jgi:hypothetical protein
MKLKEQEMPPGEAERFPSPEERLQVVAWIESALKRKSAAAGAR